jgi:hypothetical protein
MWGAMQGRTALIDQVWKYFYKTINSLQLIVRVHQHRSTVPQDPDQPFRQGPHWRLARQVEELLVAQRALVLDMHRPLTGVP